MPPKRLGGDTAMHGRVGGLVRGKKLRKGACELLGRVKNVGAFRELDNTMQIRLEKPKASRSKKAVKRGRAGADKDVTQAAIQTMLATKGAPQRWRPLEESDEEPHEEEARSITAGPAAALGTAARGAKLVVEARGAYNATSKRYDFDGELGAPHSICEVGQLIHDGKLKISKLQKDKSYGIPYATMARWAMDDKKWREKQNLSGGEGKRAGRYYETTRVDGQLKSICGAAKRDYDVTLENQKGQGHAAARRRLRALTKNVELVAPLLRAFQEQYGKMPLDNVGNYDETFLDLCAYASTGAYLVPSDDVAVQVLIPFEKSPHITLLIFTLGGKLLRILVGIIGTTDIAPHPFHLSLVKDKARADLPQGIIQRAKAKFADLMRSQTMNRAKLDFGNALGKGDAAEADAGERSAGAQNLDRAMEMARADVEAVGGAVHKAYTPPVDLDEAAAVHVPRRTREDRAQYGLVVTDDDYVKAISSEGARALAERAAEAAKASKVSERWEKRRAEIRAVEKQVADGAPLENLKVGQLKSLIYGRTGSGAKASNNKEGAMLAARVAPSRSDAPADSGGGGAEDSADAAGDGSDGELEDGADDP
ncbi:hypothetical protein JL720_13931 [Aureococcus anophagefferens]|nr:hypothetical protein JL720_13931 [Aureococcus anophagefferens]